MGRRPLSKEVALERELKRKEERRLERMYAPESLGFMCEKPNPRPPAFVLAERDRRLSSPMTLSMLIFGDPRFFQSALWQLTGQQTA